MDNKRESTITTLLIESLPQLLLTVRFIGNVPSAEYETDAVAVLDEDGLPPVKLQEKSSASALKEPSKMSVVPQLIVVSVREHCAIGG